MASATEKKQVIIQHPCVFTRGSLKHILTHSSKASPATVVASVATLADCDRPLQRFPDTHLIILNLQNRDATADISLSHRISHLREHYPRCRVIIIAEAFCVRLLRQYFYHVSQVCAVIARQAPLSEFITQINTAFFPRLYPKWRQPVRLTYQERMILTLLLRGRSNNAIADYLCLSNKTISYHKRSVMKRICRELSPHSPNSRSLFLSAPYLVGYPLAQPPAKGLTATHLGRH